MKKGSLLIVVVVLLLNYIFLVSAVTTKTINVCKSGCDYSIIQTAIDSANDFDTINVSSGTYNENQIIINKPLSIIGAGKTKSIIDGGKVTLSDPGLIRINSTNDVIFKGFTLKNAGGPINSGDFNDDNTNVLIYIEGGVGASYFISENEFIGTNRNDNSDFLIYDLNGKEDLFIFDNEFKNNGANAIILEKHTGITDISHNDISNGISGTDAILFLTYSNVDVTSIQRVIGNNIDCSNGPSDISHRSSAISFISSDSLNSHIGAGKFANIKISENNISELKNYRIAISLKNRAIDNGSSGEIIPLITNNNIIGVSGSNNNHFIYIEGMTRKLLLTGNNVNDVKNIFEGKKGINGNSNNFATETKVNQNSFTNSLNFIFDGSETIDAKSNWWGDCHGPTIAYDPNINYIPYLGACVEDLSLSKDCLIAKDNVVLRANITSNNCIGNVIFEITKEGVKQNISATKTTTEWNYIYTLNNLPPREIITWKVYAEDCNSHNDISPLNSFYVNQRTNISIIPTGPDGNGKWFISRPKFKLDNPDATSIFYRWDSDVTKTYANQFSLEDAPNNGNVTGGVLALSYWSNVCNETSQKIIIYADFTNPLIKDITPAESSSIIYTKPLISAYAEEFWSGNSGVNKSSVIMKIDGDPVNPSVYDGPKDKLDALIKYTPISDLGFGDHNVYIYLKDNAGSVSEKSWNFTIIAPVDFDINVSSPENKIYDERRVKFMVKTGINVSKMEFINFNDKKPSYKTLCTKCDSYGFVKSKYESVNEGVNRIVIRATDIFGNIKEKEINLTADSVEPKINNIQPNKNSVVNGSRFYLKYSENNIVNTKLYLRKNSTVSEVIEFDCPSGINQECSYPVNLSDYDSSEIEYYFSIEDILGNIAKSNKFRIKVDTSSPVIQISSPVEGESYPSQLLFKINISEPVTLLYLDSFSSNQKFTKLCSNCNDYGLSKQKKVNFKSGSHELTIKAVDKAGNSIEQKILFSVN